MLHAGGDGSSNGVDIIVNVEISKEVVRVEKWHGTWKDHCRTDDDPPTHCIIGIYVSSASTDPRRV